MDPNWDLSSHRWYTSDLLLKIYTQAVIWNVILYMKKQQKENIHKPDSVMNNITFLACFLPNFFFLIMWNHRIYEFSNINLFQSTCKHFLWWLHNILFYIIHPQIMFFIYLFLHSVINIAAMIILAYCFTHNYILSKRCYINLTTIFTYSLTGRKVWKYILC